VISVAVLRGAIVLDADHSRGRRRYRNRVPPCPCHSCPHASYTRPTQKETHVCRGRWCAGPMSWLKRIAESIGLMKHEVAIVVVGLDNSGKTTLINHIKPKKVRLRRCHGLWIKQVQGSNLAVLVH
jgi:hypothetical protein